MTPAAGDGLDILVSACGRTDPGRVREENQDGLLIADLGRSGQGPGPLDYSLDVHGSILLVADGMGGRAGGARASGIAVEIVRATLLREPDGSSGPDAAKFARSLAEALKEANRAIHEEGSRDGEFEGMGTTATLAGILGDRVYVAQVGDSRAYLVRNGQIGRLTRDQSLVQDLIDSGILDEDDAHSVKDNMLLQALGVGPAVRPVHTVHELRRRDVLILCSDGLSQVVRDDEIGAAAGGAPDCATLCDDLVALANARGGPDNITVLAARVDGDGLREPGEEDRVIRRSHELPES